MKRWSGLVAAAIGIGVLAVWWFHGRSQSVPPASPVPPAPPPRNPDFVTHHVGLPITTEEQLAKLEQRLTEIGFTVGWFKDGLNISGHSLVGKYEDVSFRVQVVHRYTGTTQPGTLSVTSEAYAPSREQAEDASRKLLDYLDYQIGSDQQVAPTSVPSSRP